ncbi:hypothetical protein DYH09_31510 [bacterium CPR1]|nr:hypothetical protein [bacterium CPR1]
MALPTALFMALFIYFLSTVLTWQAQMNQRFTRGEAERSHELYATRGQVNLFIAQVLEDSSYADAHGPGSPVEEELDGKTYRTWCQPDGSNPDVLHVICTVDGKLMSYQSSRTIVRTVAMGMIVYTDVGGAAGPPALKWYGLNEASPSWQDLPPIPQQVFQQKEILDGAVPFAPPQFEPGPVLVDLSKLDGPAEIANFAAYGIGPDGDLLAIYEPPPTSRRTDPASPTSLVNYPTMFRFDRSAGSWVLTRMPDSYVPTGAVGARIGGTNGTMVVQDGDGLLRLDTDPSERVPPPPGGAIQSFTANSDKIYAQLSDGSIARYATSSGGGGGWSTMLAPQPDAFTPSGEFLSGEGQSTPTLSQLTVSSNGTLMALWQRDGVDTVFRYHPGTPDDPEDPPQWDARLPLTMADNPDVPFVEDLDSISSMPGRVIAQVPGPPEEIYAGRSRLPSPGANAPVIATGMYPLPDGRAYYAGDSY